MAKLKWIAAVAVLVMAVTTVVVARVGLPDVPENHPHRTLGTLNDRPLDRP